MPIDRRKVAIILDKLRIEYSQLIQKINNLSYFLENEKTNISTYHTDLLNEQLNAMIKYADILNVRMNDLAKKLEESE